MAALLAALGGNAVRAQGEASSAARRTVWDGVYTNEQARRGEAAYGKECASCHSANLRGEDLAPALLGDTFHARWENDVVDNLFTFVKLTMPQDRPATLSDDTYTDIVAYLLKMNEFPAGQRELSTDPAELKQIAFKRP
jgi:quinoprotein glucose dehydrogenase